MPEREDLLLVPLLLVPYPFSDLSATKRRPVLVLTTQDSYGDFIALPVTSRPQTEHGLPIVASDLVTANDFVLISDFRRVGERNYLSDHAFTLATLPGSPARASPP